MVHGDTCYIISCYPILQRPSLEVSCENSDVYNRILLRTSLRVVLIERAQVPILLANYIL